jgi:hypothetical protein
MNPSSYDVWRSAEELHSHVPTPEQLEADWAALVSFHAYKQKLFTSVQEDAPKRCTNSY